MYVIGSVLYLAVTIVSGVEATSYTNPYSRALQTASLQPNSLRAWSSLMDIYMVADDYERYNSAFEHIVQLQSNSLFPYIKNIKYKGCYFEKKISDQDWKSVTSVQEVNEYFPQATIAELNELVDEIIRNDCTNVNPFKLEILIVSLTEKEFYFNHRHMLHELASLLCIHIGDPECARNNLDESIAIKPSAQKYELKLKILIALEDFESAKSVLRQYQDFLHSDPYQYLAYKNNYDDYKNRIYNAGEEN